MKEAAIVKMIVSATLPTVDPPTVNASQSLAVMTIPLLVMKIQIAALERVRVEGASLIATPPRRSEATKMAASAPSTTNVAPTTVLLKPALPPASPPIPPQSTLMGATAPVTLNAALPTVTAPSTSACPLATLPPLKAPIHTAATAPATLNATRTIVILRPTRALLTVV